MPSHRPDKGRLTAAQRAALIRRVTEIQKDEGLSNAAVARMLRYSPSVWSMVAAGKYAGDSDKVLARAQEWIEHRSRRSASGRLHYIETSIAAKVRSVCEAAADLPTIGRIEMPSGCGKTLALAQFARERPDRRLHVQAGQCFRTRRGLLGELIHRLGLAVSSEATTEDLYRAVRDHFATFYAGGGNDPFCLLVDEATVLLPATIDMLRNLHDDPEARIGLVLVDTLRLDVELQSRGGVRYGYEQTKSRAAAVFRWPADREIAAADVRLVGKAVLDALGFEGVLDRAAWSYLQNAAQQPGRLRNVENLLTRCRDVAQRAGAEPTYSARELDFVAPIVDLPQQFTHDAPPFESADESAEAASAAKADARAQVA